MNLMVKFWIPMKSRVFWPLSVHTILQNMGIEKQNFRHYSTECLYTIDNLQVGCLFGLNPWTNRQTKQTSGNTSTIPVANSTECYQSPSAIKFRIKKSVPKNRNQQKLFVGPLEPSSRSQKIWSLSIDSDRKQTSKLIILHWGNLSMLMIHKENSSKTRKNGHFVDTTKYSKLGVWTKNVAKTDAVL